ncbi:MAG TPA: flagellar protein F [Methanothermococcus okinawensis]|uniref:Flagellar protein F n=1 Tax=Methanothermococcus okinawensis TaxID=155863 RepID=A0A833DR49_9EURY|nr:flagellar protein F [Methanothermococcus okinawensis]
MGFSSTAGLIIILSTILVCSIYLYTSIDLNVGKIYEAYVDHVSLLNNKLHEKLTIVSSANSSSNINLTVVNEGSITLEPSKWTVLYNGTPINFSINPNKKYLTPLNDVNISINATAPARLCIISEYGNKYYYSLN